jgi:hypothetical protein
MFQRESRSSLRLLARTYTKLTAFDLQSAELKIVKGHLVLYDVGHWRGESCRIGQVMQVWGLSRAEFKK